MTNFGLFLELEEGIDGLVHVSDLSWTKKIKHPGDFTKVGEKLDVVVLELDADNRRLALGHKQLEENPIGRWLMNLDHIQEDSMPNLTLFISVKLLALRVHVDIKLLSIIFGNIIFSS